MADNKNIHEQDEESILSIIQDIKDGTINPKTLSKEDRQRCVELLIGEGYTEAAVAQILARSEKTISRDLVDLRERSAITPDINLAKQIIGDMFQKAMSHHKYLMRLARSSEASHGEKAQSEFLAWRVMKEVVEKMQSLGYLPAQPKTIVGDVFHHMAEGDAASAIADINKQIIEVESIINSPDNAALAAKKDIDQVKALVDEIKLSNNNKKEI
ncbi:MAG: hypothetical protein KBB52_05755 [Candidatus Omnitrophica bacterium]|nr:hypothetical protein [Candidatus Omnitrophota bacterium]